MMMVAARMPTITLRSEVQKLSLRWNLDSVGLVPTGACISACEESSRQRWAARHGAAAGPPPRQRPARAPPSRRSATVSLCSGGGCVGRLNKDEGCLGVGRLNGLGFGVLVQGVVGVGIPPPSPPLAGGYGTLAHERRVLSGISSTKVLGTELGIVGFLPLPQVGTADHAELLAWLEGGTAFGTELEQHLALLATFREDYERRLKTVCHLPSCHMRWGFGSAEPTRPYRRLVRGTRVPRGEGRLYFLAATLRVTVEPMSAEIAHRGARPATTVPG